MTGTHSGFEPTPSARRRLGPECFCPRCGAFLGTMARVELSKAPRCWEELLDAVQE